MIRLLKAGLFRLKKEVLFWLFIFLTIGIAGYGLIKCSSVESVSFDNVVNEFIMYIGLFIAIFVSIFVGKEYFLSNSFYICRKKRYNTTR